MIELLLSIGADLLESTVLKKLEQSGLLKYIRFLKKVHSSFANPNLFIKQNINKYIQQLTPIQSQELNNYLNKIVNHKHFAQQFNNLMPHANQKISSSLSKNLLEKASNISKKTNAPENLQLIHKIASLKSSWLSYGVYVPTFKVGSEIYGALNLTLLTGKSYSYAGVPYYSCWLKMVNANGAGKEFWTGYLDNYIALGKTTKKRLSKEATIIKRKLRRQTTTAYANAYQRYQARYRKHRRI